MNLKKISWHTETAFEKLTSISISILGSATTFMIAILVVGGFWLSGKQPWLHDGIRDVVHGFTFLSLFLIQKSFNRFSATLHLKLNELIASNEKANNAVINVEAKTEHEIYALSKEYDELAELAGLAKHEEIMDKEDLTKDENPQ